MIEGLDKVLESSGQPGITELRGLLEELLGGPEAEGRWIDQQMLQQRAARVFRLRFAIHGHVRTLVVKRLKPEIARRNELVTKRWLPATGLGDSGSPLLGSIAEHNGICIWHVYDDLGPYELDPGQPDPQKVKLAIKLIARMHARFAGHPLLGEIRLHGGDLGIHFYESNVGDAIRALEACGTGGEQEKLRERLLRRLYELRGELPLRALALKENGGPETLLHGDLWAINVFVVPTSDGLQARLIDWDHAAVGPASYDLSTFLLRFQPQYRSWILDAYRAETAREGWRLPPARELNFLFETAEYARFANRVIWPAIALVQDRAPWGWDVLAEVDQWFEDLQPVLPCEQETPSASAAQT